MWLRISGWQVAAPGVGWQVIVLGMDASAYASARNPRSRHRMPLPFGEHPYVGSRGFDELRMRCGLFESRLKKSER